MEIIIWFVYDLITSFFKDLFRLSSILTIGIGVIIFFTYVTLNEVLELKESISELKTKANQLEDEIEKVGAKCGS